MSSSNKCLVLLLSRVVREERRLTRLFLDSPQSRQPRGVAGPSSSQRQAQVETAVSQQQPSQGLPVLMSKHLHTSTPATVSSAYTSLGLSSFPSSPPPPPPPPASMIPPYHPPHLHNMVNTFG